ncbi:phage major capsid protein [Paludisphaera rhizosphaerae]|uniref:phage major capsid protein n=1 Tax=Paludisphaera rhizosphaerae TaxID=2711216 RepID=UPI0013EBD43D|nr:phage major capsid protein [Paludisphaera rhizosphaerae]
MPVLNPRTGRVVNVDGYSLARAVASAAECKNRQNLLPSGLEGDVHDLLRDLGDGRRGFRAPLSAFTPPDRKLRSLDLTSGAGAVQVKLAPADDFVDVLRRKSVCGLLGCVLGGLVDENGVPMAVPLLGAGSSAGWIADGQAAPPSTPTIAGDPGIVTTIAARVNVTRRMLKMAGPSLEDFLTGEMTRSVSSELDRAVLAGDGNDGEPTGLLNVVGVPVQAIAANGGAPTRAVLIDAEKTVGLANGDASASASMGWVGSPKVRAKLRGTDGSTGSAGAWLWNDSDRVLGKAAFATTSMPDDLTKGSGTNLSALAFGDWSTVSVGMPETAQVIIDPIGLGMTGGVRMTVFLDVRVSFRRPTAFVLIKDVATA